MHLSFGNCYIQYIYGSFVADRSVVRVYPKATLLQNTCKCCKLVIYENVATVNELKFAKQNANSLRKTN